MDLDEVDGHSWDFADDDSPEGVCHGEVCVAKLELEVEHAAFKDGDLRLAIVDAVEHLADLSLLIPALPHVGIVSTSATILHVKLSKVAVHQTVLLGISIWLVHRRLERAPVVVVSLIRHHFIEL